MTRRQAANDVHRCTQDVGPCRRTGWHRYTYHETGVMWAEEYRPLYGTRREAIDAVLAAERDRARIDEWKRQLDERKVS